MDTLSRDWIALSASLDVKGVRVFDRGDAILIERRSISWPRLALALASTAALIALAVAHVAPWTATNGTAAALAWGGLVFAGLIFAGVAVQLSRSGACLVAEPRTLTWSDRGWPGGQSHRVAYRDIRAIEVCDSAGTALSRQHGLRSIGSYHVTVWQGPFMLRTIAADNPDAAERIQQALIAAIGEMRVRARSGERPTLRSAQ